MDGENYPSSSIVSLYQWLFHRSIAEAERKTCTELKEDWSTIKDTIKQFFCGVAVSVSGV